MSRLRLLRQAAVALAATALASSAFGQTQTMAVPKLKPGEYKPVAELPNAVKDLGFDQKLGAQVPLDTEFTDSNGNQVELASFFNDRPVILAPVYYECPMLCSLVLDGIVRGIKPLQFSPGTEFDVLAISFDHEESFESAAMTRDGILSRYRREGTEGGWHFLTGDEASVSAIMDAVGFKYEYNPQTDLWGHAGGVVVLTPEGEVSRYFYGVDYAPKDLRLGLLDASDGKIGSLVDQVLLFCYQYDPAVGKYSASILNIIRAVGVLTVVLLVTFIFFNRHRTTGGESVARA